MSLEEMRGLDTIESFAYFCATRMNGSGEAGQLLEYLAEENPSGRNLYYSLINEYSDDTETKEKSEEPNSNKPSEESSKKFEPDPSLEGKIEEILQIIQKSGKVMEENPSPDDNENRLRAELLNVLKNKLKENVTAEEYNKRGRTDIKISNKDNTLFISECKIWDGLSEYKKAIEQLLGYQNWRNRYAALILFVKKKSITNVIDTIKNETKNVKNYEKFIDEKEESWFNFMFHNPGDKRVKIKLAVLVFHIYK